METKVQEAHCISYEHSHAKFALLPESPLSHNHGHPGTVSHYDRPLAITIIQPGQSVVLANY